MALTHSNGECIMHKKVKSLIIQILLLINACSSITMYLGNGSILVYITLNRFGVVF